MENINSTLELSKEQAVELYKLLEYCKKTVLLLRSSKISKATRESMLGDIAAMQTIIADKYQPDHDIIVCDSVLI